MTDIAPPLPPELGGEVLPEGELKHFNEYKWMWYWNNLLFIVLLRLKHKLEKHYVLWK